MKIEIKEKDVRSAPNKGGKGKGEGREQDESGRPRTTFIFNGQVCVFGNV